MPLTISSAVAEFSALSPLSRLIALLDSYTDKDLAADPPTDAMPLGNLGLSATKLDAFIRPKINSRYGPDAQGNALYVRGALKPSITFGALRQKCKV